jgi:hypothetical protein
VYELYCGLSSTTQNQRDPSQQSSNCMTCQDPWSPRTPNLMQLLWLAFLGKLWRHKAHTLLVSINHKKQVSQPMFFIHWCAWIVPVQVLSFKNWQKMCYYFTTSTPNYWSEGSELTSAEQGQ